MGKKNFGFYIKEYLTFSRTQRNGILVLLAMLVILILSKLFLPKLFFSKSPINIREFEKEISLFEKSDSAKNISTPAQGYSNVPKYYTKTNADLSNIPKRKKIELNSADTISLLNLQGIGPVYAQRIVKYRQLLGGFYTLDQLSEVYGLKTETIKKFTNFLTVDTLKISKIDINTSEFKTINAHPYISYEQTKEIFRLRVRQKIKSLKELKEKEIFSTVELNRIRPYLIIN